MKFNLLEMTYLVLLKAEKNLTVDTITVFVLTKSSIFLKVDKNTKVGQKDINLVIKPHISN